IAGSSNTIGSHRMPRLVTLNHAAEQLGLSLAALRDWRFRRKHLDFVKVGRAIRVLQSSIDLLIESKTTPAEHADVAASGNWAGRQPSTSASRPGATATHG